MPNLWTPTARTDAQPAAHRRRTDRAPGRPLQHPTHRACRLHRQVRNLRTVDVRDRTATVLCRNRRDRTRPASRGNTPVLRPVLARTRALTRTRRARSKRRTDQKGRPLVIFLDLSHAEPTPQDSAVQARILADQAVSIVRE